MAFKSDLGPAFYEGESMNQVGGVRSHDAFQIIVSEEFAANEKGYATGPERALMLAMLFDAVQGYICYSQLPENRKASSPYREAYYWVHSSAKDYIFSFTSVCEALGLNPSYLTLGLLNIVNSKTEHKRARRKF